MSSYSFIAAGDLSDMRIQCWAIDGSGQLWSRWKTTTDASAPWTAWTTFQMPAGVKIVFITCVSLSDNRPQLWAIDSSGKLWSCWKTTTTSSSAWTPWTAFQMPSGISSVKSISGSRLTDNRPQIFCSDNAGGLWSCWKTTTTSSSAWTPWSTFN
ncbi:MAG: hypothetical protein ABI876_16230 [Bacteroidota bacterium]